MEKFQCKDCSYSTNNENKFYDHCDEHNAKKFNEAFNKKNFSSKKHKTKSSARKDNDGKDANFDDLKKKAQTEIKSMTILEQYQYLMKNMHMLEPYLRKNNE